MIKFIATKIFRFFYRLLTKIIYFIIPVLSKIFTILKLNSRIVNQLNKLRYESHKMDDHRDLISKLLIEEKLIALDVGAQGGFFDAGMFAKKYNSFFKPIVVEPILSEAEKLNKRNYNVISKGFWSTNCKKKLYILGKRSGSSSMYKPSRENYDLYNVKKKDFSNFDITNEIDVECTTVGESLNALNIKNLEFLKIDTQGSELEILKGLGAYRPLMMKVEVQVMPMYEGVPNWGKLINYLYELNYITCEWQEIGAHVTKSPVEMDMIFIPNYLNELGKKFILSNENKFISMMLIFGQIKLLQVISKKLNFSIDSKLQKINDRFFN